ncbi:hypothetical protein SISSUDRAFT_1067569 [Sistotremastrum suecicum HHB10207 ss-3]|uniref:Uncharacterized protein n=1 Tax=Sistotremastrum suecicum HHB10207 ss-3 TaxID=1314776 RepID=A0A165WZ22_9AGAM|nr:hypothetical protein SISSUDRAFT_1067569 [Sistotremastrum suecicum HHB10207 ss-3]
MALPPELCCRIAKFIRQTDSQSLQEKSHENWKTEHKTLTSLSFVSRIWRDVVTPILWSQLNFVTVKYGDIEAVSDQIFHASHILAYSRPKSEPKLSTYVECLTIYIKNPSTRAVQDTEIDLRIMKLLSLTSDLRYLRIMLNPSRVPVLTHLSYLKYPRLKVVDIDFDESSRRNDQLSLGEFLVNNPSIEDVRLVVERPIQWRSLREYNPLPKMKRFIGNFSQLGLLASAPELTSVECEVTRRTLVRLDFINELSLLANPFPNVTHLCVYSLPIPLYVDTVGAISQSFPALESLEGLSVTKLFIEFMKSPAEEIAGCLSRLQTIAMSERVGFGTSYVDGVMEPEIDNESMERAFESLPHFFPTIRVAIHVKNEANPIPIIRRLEMRYLPSGNTMERTEEIPDPVEFFMNT